MPKGRRFAPETETDGVWFHHRGLPVWSHPQRHLHTTTGVMLHDPYLADSCRYPPAPPQPYQKKDTRNFKLSNSFSAHDNRHSFQDHGVYFGNGKEERLLGKQLTSSDLRQHFTDKSFLKHYGKEVVEFDYNTMYGSSFQGRPISDTISGRRFPRIHPDAQPGLSRLSTSTTSWYTKPDIPHKTPTHVMAVSQEPFLPHNTWKYAYHGIPKCYPPYDRVNHNNPYPVWMVTGKSGKATKAA